MGLPNFLSRIVAGSAIASAVSINSSVSCRIFVSLRAMSNCSAPLASSFWDAASQDIGGASNEFQVFRIHASSIATKMVCLKRLRRSSFEEMVGRNSYRMRQIKSAISALNGFSCPVYAAVSSTRINSSPKANDWIGNWWSHARMVAIYLHFVKAE